MSLSIQTNVNSLTAQQNMSVNNAFQSKTIQQLTSGYRINHAGDDAAGLAVANQFASGIAQLTQGVANGNDGVAQLQIMDGGMSNISQILNRLQTLATQSASGTFTGLRTTLNTEFQNDLSEIDRQSQSIGLNAGGTFAQNLNVYLGEGSGSQSLNNGIVTLNLAGSAVDSQSLGMKGMQALAGTAGTTDIGANSTTSVSTILANSANIQSESTQGSANFYFAGPGFSGASQVKASVNLTGVTDTTSLVLAINQAIGSAAGNGPAGAAFGNAGIVASVNTDSSGKQQLAFTSATTAFQVEAGDQMANALMGNFQPSSTTGKALTNTVTGAATAAAGTTFSPATSAVTVQIQGAGLASPVDLILNSGASHDNLVSDATTDLKNQVSSSTALQAAGISLALVSGKLQFTSARGEQFNVMATGDTTNQLGLGSFVTNSSAASQVDYNAITGTASVYSPTSTADQATMQFSINGAAATPVTVDLTAGDAAASSVKTSIIANPNIVATTNDAYSFSVDGIAVASTLSGANEHATITGVSLTTPVAVTAGTKSSATGTNALATHDWSVLNADEQFTVAVNGGQAQTVTLNTSYTDSDAGAGNAADLAFLATINGQLQGVTASMAGNKLVFTANTAGAGSIVVGGTMTNIGGGFGVTTTAGANGNNKLMIAVDGGTAQEVDVLNGSANASFTSAGGAWLVALNAALSTAFTGQKVTASIVGGNLTFASSTATVGANSLLNISQIPATGDVTDSGMTALLGGTATQNSVGTAVTAATIAAALQAQINTATGVNAATAGYAHATVTVNNDNSITITNDNKGAGHTMSAISGNATAVLGAAAATLGTDRSGADMQNYLNQVFSSTAALKPAQLQATWANNALTVASGNSTNFRINSGSTAAATMTATDNVSGGVNFSLGNQAFKINANGAGWQTITLTTDTTGAGATGAGNVATAINTALGLAGVAATASVVTTDSTHSYLMLTSTLTGSTSSVQVQGTTGGITGALAAGKILNGLTTVAQTADADLGFGVSGANFTTAGLTASGASANMTSGVPLNYAIDAGGASSANLTVSSVTHALSFSALQFGNDSQAITITANGANGVPQSKTITLQNINTGSVATTNRSGSNIDQAINYINTQLQQSDNATLQKITAVKENNGTGNEINFISSLSSFNVGVGSTANTDGVAGGVSKNVAVGVVGAGANMSIDTQSNAEAAVTAVAAAVSKLGTAQAAVGIGENQLSYAINLASSQITNYSAAEAQIRDADVAQQAANLTKAQVLQQATIAAMAQANSSPQAVLKLLQ